MKKLITLISALSVVLIAGCSKDTAIQLNDVDKITLDLVSTQKLPQGYSYIIKLTNGSSHVIKQNDVYLSYPTKVANGEMANTFKVEANGNKLDIQPKDEFNLTVFVPVQSYVDYDKLQVDHPYAEIKGYLDTVSPETLFNSSGSILYGK